MDGTTNREGRVEVCKDGRWGAVCNNEQEGIAGVVCSLLGFPGEGNTKYRKKKKITDSNVTGAKKNDSTHTGWRQTYNCILNSTHGHDCGEFLCDNSYLTVRCLTHQEVSNKECEYKIS